MDPWKPTAFYMDINTHTQTNTGQPVWANGFLSFFPPFSISKNSSRALTYAAMFYSITRQFVRASLRKISTAANAAAAA